MAGAAVGETPSLTQEFVEKWARDEQGSCTVPSLAPPLQTVPHGNKECCPALWNTKGPAPLQLVSCAKQRNMAKMKEQSKTSERQLSNEEIANLSDGEYKALVIKMLTDPIELGWKMKDTQNEIKQNIHGTNRDRKETRIQINDLEQKGEINI